MLFQNLHGGLKNTITIHFKWSSVIVKSPDTEFTKQLVSCS